MADQNSAVFRKVSIDRLSSPEQLDKRLTIVSPIGWIALTAMVIVVVAAIVWGIFGSITDKIGGNGMLIYGDGIINVISKTSGQITDISIREGDYVIAGQTLARVSQPQIVSQLRTYRDKLSALDAVDTDTFTIDIKKANYEIYSAFSALSQQIALNPDVPSLKEEFTDTKELLLREINEQIALLESELNRTDSIIASYSGTILDANISENDYVSVGQTAFSMSRASTTMEDTKLLIYVPIAEGKRIVEGMEVDVSPSTVNTSEYGKIIGRVRSVSEYAVSVESVRNKLNNNDLVEAFMSQGPVIEVQVELLRDMNTPSGYKWSASNGPNEKISAGVLCSAEFHIGKYRPIEFVLPFLKNIL